MPEPQRAIFHEGSRHHHFLEYSLNGAADNAALAQSISAARKAAEASPVAMVVAFGPKAWRRLSPDQTPEALCDFQPITGANHQAPATQRDVFVWVHGEHHDDVLDLALAANKAFQPTCAPALDLAAFVYHDSRDLTGFIDGSANPKDDARIDAALVPDGEVGAGGAFVFTQRWVHDLEAFGSLATEDQERIIGRTKPDSIELEGDAMPPWSHVSRTDVKIDGVAQKIYRRSAPYGTATEHGLYFLAFACDPTRIQVQLDRMYGVADDGEYDHLIDYSRAVTGSYWFAPSQQALVALK
ncbi:MAG: Dyp-type peroxidase [Rhodospirillaceae bacterium]|jgi:porphyrinogen peroxidase|nr:Dyp-type peroxidase [Rhodospirillaceae bacterium]